MDYEKKYKEAIEKARPFSEHPLQEDSSNIVEYIFPELNESKSIRLWLIDLLSTMQYHHCDEDMEMGNKALAWLKKQDADKVEPKFNIGDIVKHKDNPHLTYILKRFTDDGDYEFHAIGKDGNEGCTYFTSVKNQDDWELVEQKPAEWSEEDEEHMKWSINNLTELKDRFGEEYGRVGDCINWLKSFKPQPKYEWTEKDEINRDLIYNALNLVYDLEHNKSLCDWLNSLKPHPQWKPSEEQMDALENAIRYGEEESIGILSLLYNDLEKLREE